MKLEMIEKEKTSEECAAFAWISHIVVRNTVRAAVKRLAEELYSAEADREALHSMTCDCFTTVHISRVIGNTISFRLGARFTLFWNSCRMPMIVSFLKVLFQV